MNKATTALTLILVSAMAMVTACAGSPFGVRGSGEVVSETRDVSGFDEVHLRGSGTVQIEVTGSESLAIEAEDNLLEYLTTEVNGGTLVLDSRRSISPTKEIVYMITAAQLNGLTILGSGDITTDGITGERLEAEVSGSGSIDLRDVDVGDVTVDISGSGRIELAGNTGHLHVSISGSGNFDGADLIAETGDVFVEGSGDAVVHVTSELEADSSGSGDITYYGDPNVNANTSGSGSIGPG